MLTIHHLGISQSERIVWLCEELQLPYKLVKHTRAPTLAPDSLKSVPGNATGKAPFIEDSSTGITLSESSAIVEYIITRYGNGRLSLSSDQEGYADYLHWFHYANATLQNAMVVGMFMGIANKDTKDSPSGSMQQAIGFAESRLHASIELIDQRLAGNKWLAGKEFTAADIMSVYCLTTQRYFGPGVHLGKYTNVLRWLKDCSEREGFKKAVEKGDPEMRLLIGAEPPRESLIDAGGVESDIWRK